MSYKQFIQELEDDILPSEAERRYGYNCKIVFVLKAAGVMSFFFSVADIKNTSQSISQHRSVSILTLTKRKNGDFPLSIPIVCFLLGNSAYLLTCLSTVTLLG